jgi:hypothetical protein
MNHDKRTDARAANVQILNRVLVVQTVSVLQQALVSVLAGILVNILIQ